MDSHLKVECQFFFFLGRSRSAGCEQTNATPPTLPITSAPPPASDFPASPARTPSGNHLCFDLFDKCINRSPPPGHMIFR